MRQFSRLAETDRTSITFRVDGREISALEGDTVLTGILLNSRRLRDNEFEDRPRAGFCLMGACQDCWIWTEAGTRLRACSVPVAEGVNLMTRSPLEQWSIRPAS